MLALLLGCQIYKEVLVEAYEDDWKIKTWDGVACGDLSKYDARLDSGMDMPEVTGIIRCEYARAKKKEPGREFMRWRSAEYGQKLTVHFVSGRVSTWKLVEE